jgi:hypothetical protein
MNVIYFYLKMMKKLEHCSTESIDDEKEPASPIVIKERYEPSIEEFDDVNKFKEYLAEHFEELNKLSTYKLNKRFRVRNYRISKLSGKISLVAMNSPKRQSTDEVSILKKRIGILEQKINQIIDYVQSKH